MTFVQGFFSFIVELTNADLGVYERVRLKTPLHPDEPLEHLAARMLAFVHSYKPGLQFSEGLFNLEQPAIWRKDIVGTLLSWVEVGFVPPRRLLGALRSPAPAPQATQYRAYFYSCEQIRHFCESLRGSKTNWIADVLFHWIDPLLLQSIACNLQSSNRWTVTIVDDTLFMGCNGVEYTAHIDNLDMWNEFQKSILPEGAHNPS